MSATSRISFYTTMPDSFKALQTIEEHLTNSSISAGLRHLVKLRVSQLNGCAFCVDMHVREAIEDGEQQKRIDQLVVWPHVDFYNADERAAFAWAEALTLPGSAPALDPLYQDLQQYFDQQAIDALTMIIVMINNWNRLQIANHNQYF